MKVTAVLALTAVTAVTDYIHNESDSCVSRPVRVCVGPGLYFMLGPCNVVN